MNESGAGNKFVPKKTIFNDFNKAPKVKSNDSGNSQAVGKASGSQYLKKIAIDILLLVIKFVIIIHDFVTYPYYYFSMNVAAKRKQYEQTPFSKQDNPNDPHSPWRQQVHEQQQLRIEHQIDSFTNLPSMMQYAFKKNAKNDCYGYREIVYEQYVPKAGCNSPNTQPKTNGDTKKLLNDLSQSMRYQRQVKMSSYKWVTFGQFEEQISAAARGFLLEGIKSGDKVMLYSDTRPEWQITLQALLRINAVVCTMYATLGYDGIVHSVNETEVTHIIAQADKVTKLLNAKKDLPTLKKVIFFEQVLQTPKELGGKGAYRAEMERDLEKHPFEGKSELAPEVENVSFNTVLMRGYHLPMTDDLIAENKKVIPAKDSLAVIMYTSGSTGQPKGVLLTHRNIMATIKSFSHVTKDFVRDPLANVGCAYLPLAHIFEFCLESMMLYHGVRFGFANPQTLTNSSPGLYPGESGDVAILKPTVIIMVPLVLDRIVSGVKAGIKSKGYFKEQLVSYLLDYKTKWTSEYYETPRVNKLVCNTIAQALGGKLKYIICGSAPLSASTQTFIRNAFNVKLPQGFGTTETCSATTCQLFDDVSTLNVGPPVAGCAIKLEEWSEAGYSPNDKPNPRGEIVVGSESIATGYYKLDELTQETFYKDDSGINWYRTGDIGEFLPNGNLRIIDRKKDLVKLQNGEYISLGKVESTLKSNPYTDNFCVYADSLHNYIVALGPANEAAIIGLARQIIASHEAMVCGDNSNSNSFTEARIEELRQILEPINPTNNNDSTTEERHECLKKLCTNALVLNHILTHLTEKARQQNLLSLEIPKKLALIAEDWTEELNLVTAAMKIRRNFIYKRYQTVLNDLYRS